MKKYRSHKVVRAGKIIGMADRGAVWEVTVEKGESLAKTIPISEDIAHRILNMAEGAGVAVTEGYLISYADGYLSWSPVESFEHGYVEDNGISFGQALEGIKRGERWARSGWNGKDMFVFLVPGSHFTVNRPPLLGIYPEGTEIDYHAHIDMRTADGQVVPWLASQTDLLAEDWMQVGE